MRKSDLASAIAGKTGISKNISEELLTLILDAITNGLVEDKSVRLAGFGSFTQKERKARLGVNPRTGDAVQIAASNAVKFTPAKSLKEALRNHEL